jgi:flagellar basal-body rod modification protein FlgD
MHIQAHHLQTSPLAAMQTASSPAASASSTPSSSSSSSTSATSTATITANDFLQLLVTELQNQDPTADTDPNEYVDQLVQVNSLQQQIQMNETMDGGPTLTGSSSGLLQQLMQINQDLGGDSSTTGSAAATRGVAGIAGASSKTSAAAGNLSPATSQKMQAAAETVANALASPAHSAIGSQQTQAFEEFAARLKANVQPK